MNDPRHRPEVASATTTDHLDDQIALGLKDISDALTVAARRLELLEDGVGPVAAEDLRAHLHTVLDAADASGLDTIAPVAREMDALAERVVLAGGRPSRAVLDTLARGVEVMALLACDLERQRRGHPAAALDEAVDRLLEDIARADNGGTTAGRRLRLVRRPERAATPSEKPLVTPLGRAFAFVGGIATDAARRAGRDVVVDTDGTDAVVPEWLADAVIEPLAQLVRNSVEHGLEAPEVRIRLGKPETGRLRLAASVDGQHLVLAVSDDGGGIHVDGLRRQAERRGLVRGDDPLDPGIALALIFEPDLCSGEYLGGLAASGLGMDSVRRRIDALDGFIDVYSDLEQGTRVVLRVPLTADTPSRLRI